MGQDGKNSPVHPLLGEDLTYLAGKLTTIMGPAGPLRRELVLRLLSTAASRTTVLFLHSRLHFPIDRLKEITGGDTQRLQNIRLLYLSDFLLQERAISGCEFLIAKNNIRYLFLDNPLDNYIDALSVRWNVSSALKATHSSLIKQLATLREISIGRDVGAFFILDSNDSKTAITKYAVDLWPDIVIEIEQLEPRAGRLTIRKKPDHEPVRSFDVALKGEGKEMEWREPEHV